MAKLPRLLRLTLCLASCLALGAALPSRAEALTYSAVSSGEVERLILSFSSGVPRFAANRTDERDISLRLEGVWTREARPADSEVKGQLIRFLHATDTGVRVQLADPDFGYILEEGPDPNQLQLTVFADSMGSRWTPSDRVQAALRQPRPVEQSQAGNGAAGSGAPRAQTAQAAPAAQSGRVGATMAARPDTAVVAPSPSTALPSAGTGAEPGPRATPPPAAAQPSGTATSAQASAPSPAQPTPSAPRPAGSAGQAAGSADAGLTGWQPFFSVPYSMRAPISRVGPDEAVAYSTTPVIGQGPKLAMNIAPVRQAEQNQPARSQAAQGQPAQPEASAQAAPSPATPSQDQLAAQGTSAKPAANAEPSPANGTAEPAAQSADEPVQDAKSDAGGGDAAAQSGEAPGSGGAEDDGPVDSQGKPILSFEEQYQVAVRHFVNGEYSEAMEVYKQLRDNPEVKGAMREEVLHNLAQASYNIYRDTLRDHFHEVVGAYEAAINFNPDSEKVPQALLQLGLAHLRVDNIPEATAYFKILADKYPYDMNLPYIDFYWGEYYFRKGMYKEAADAYQVVVQDHPDTPVIREAALGLARSLEKLEYFEQAYQIVDFIDKRWPRFYIEDPEFLRLSGELANRLQRFGEAKDDLWNYYNMQPDATGNDVVLARIGDIYLRAGQRDAARDIYRTVAARYPEDEGGLVAKMRLAEEGIYDSPSLDQMYKVFDRPFNLRPEEIYTQIVRKYPKSALAPLAQLKLSMWNLFNNRYWETLGDVNTMLRLFPDSALTAKAVEVGIQAFEQGARLMAQEGNFARIVDTWDRHPFIPQRGETLNPQSRLVVATAMNEVGRPGDALEIVKPLLTGAMQGEASQGAMMLALRIYLDEEAWGRIEALSETVAKWNLPPEQRRQFDFSLALALENLGKSELALSLWTKLAADMELEPDQRGYALYYMARAAAQKEDYRNQFLYSREALALFLQSGDDKEKIKDCLLSLVEVCRKVRQLEQALHWALEYEKYITEDDPEWPASHFRLAEIHRGLGNDGEWRRLLDELIAKKPDSLFGRMAASTLKSMALERQVDRYRPEIDTATGR